MLNTCSSSEKMMLLSLLLHGFWHTSLVYTWITWIRKIKIIMSYDAAWKLSFLIGSLSAARHTDRIGSFLSFIFFSQPCIFLFLCLLSSPKSSHRCTYVIMCHRLCQPWSHKQFFGMSSISNFEWFSLWARNSELLSFCPSSFLGMLPRHCKCWLVIPYLVDGYSIRLTVCCIP